MPAFLLLEDGGKLLLDEGPGALLLDEGEPPPPPPTPEPTVATVPGLSAGTFADGGALIGTGFVKWAGPDMPPPITVVEDAVALLWLPSVRITAEAVVVREARATMPISCRITALGHSRTPVACDGEATVKIVARIEAKGHLWARVDDSEVALIISLLG